PSADRLPEPLDSRGVDPTTQTLVKGAAPASAPERPAPQQSSAWVAGLASGLLWGSGQAMNRQYAKGLVFLTLMVATVATELVTGYYGNLTSYSVRRNGGFFLRGLWGLITLGTEPRSTGLTGLTDGDHSIVLMVNGLIALLTLRVIAALDRKSTR